MLRNLYKYILFFTLCICTIEVSAQDATSGINPKINSPYSRFGLGDFVDQYFAASAGMAGLGAAIQDPYHYNQLNPASLAYLQTTAFEVGLYGQLSNLESASQSENIWSGNLAYLSLAFPIKNPINQILDRDRSPFGWGMSFSLVPYTIVGYNLEATEQVEDLKKVDFALRGSGGTYKVQWGNGFRYKNFAFGTNLGFLFGKLTYGRQIQFDSLDFSYITELIDDISIGSFYSNFGAQYVLNFKKPGPNGDLVFTGERLVFGATVALGNDFDTNSSRFFHRDNFIYNELDSIVFESDIRELGTLPLEWSIGVNYEKVNKFRLGIEYSAGQWSEFRNEARNQTTVNLLDSWRFAVGGEYIPDISSYNSYFRRVRYRFGAFYGTDPRDFQGEQLTKYGLSFGFGFPIILPRQQTSFIEFSVEAGRFGLEEVVRDTYLKFTLGFTLNDNSWFFKRKFN